MTTDTPHTESPTWIDEMLGTTDDRGPVLWGSRCPFCHTVTFPEQRSCPKCTRVGAERHALPREGTLWSWTIQGFPPKSPPYRGSAETFESYGVGYVELGGEVRVEAILTTSDPERLRIGMPMRLVTLPVSDEAAQRPVVTFAFAPAQNVSA